MRLGYVFYTFLFIASLWHGVIAWAGPKTEEQVQELLHVAVLAGKADFRSVNSICRLLVRSPKKQLMLKLIKQEVLEDVVNVSEIDTENLGEMVNLVFIIVRNGTRPVSISGGAGSNGWYRLDFRENHGTRKDENSDQECFGENGDVSGEDCSSQDYYSSDGQDGGNVSEAEGVFAFSL